MIFLQIIPDLPDVANNLVDQQGNDFAWYITALSFIILALYAGWNVVQDRKDAAARTVATAAEHAEALKSQREVFEAQAENYRGIIEQTNKALDANTLAMSALRNELHNVTTLLSTVIGTGGFKQNQNPGG